MASDKVDFDKILDEVFGPVPGALSVPVAAAPSAPSGYGVVTPIETYNELGDLFVSKTPTWKSTKLRMSDTDDGDDTSSVFTKRIHPSMLDFLEVIAPLGLNFRVFEPDPDMSGKPEKKEKKGINHVKEEAPIFPIAPEFFVPSLTTQVLGLKKQQALGIASVLASGKHLPLLDLSCTGVPESSLIEELKAFGMPFTLVKSGKSYHYYGDAELTYPEWVQFMGKCLLLDELTDVRYVGHRLITGVGILRVTSCRGKQSIPEVVFSNRLGHSVIGSTASSEVVSPGSSPGGPTISPSTISASFESASAVAFAFAPTKPKLW